MIWSVSTSGRSSDGDRPADAAERLHARRQLARVDEVAGDRRRRGELRADQVRAAAASLPALEVAVRGRGAALAVREHVGIHAEAHRAAGAAPLEAGVEEDPVEPFLLGAAA